MINLEDKNTRKGRLWAIFYVWPVFIIFVLMNFKPENADIFNWLLVVALCCSGLVWTFILIQKIRKIRQDNSHR